MGGGAGHLLVYSQKPPTLALPAPARAWGEARLPSWRLLLAPERTFQLSEPEAHIPVCTQTGQQQKALGGQTLTQHQDLPIPSLPGPLWGQKGPG